MEGPSQHGEPQYLLQVAPQIGGTPKRQDHHHQYHPGGWRRFLVFVAAHREMSNGVLVSNTTAPPHYIRFD